MNKPFYSVLFAVLFCVPLIGCEVVDGPGVDADARRVNYRVPSSHPAIVALADRPPEGTIYTSGFPFADLPVEHRQKNWTRGGSGSCVIASSCSVFRTQGRDDLAEIFRREYGGGQTSASLMAKLNAQNVVFCATTNGDERFFDWCDRTHRWAVIFFFPAHSICYAGGTPEKVWLLDNNRTSDFIEMDRREFLRKWRGYGGFACGIITGVPPSLEPHG